MEYDGTTPYGENLDGTPINKKTMKTGIELIAEVQNRTFLRSIHRHQKL